MADKEPLITVEAALRFQLACANDKIKHLEKENAELRALAYPEAHSFLMATMEEIGKSNDEPLYQPEHYIVTEISPKEIEDDKGK